MFYCEECRIENKWPEAFTFSHGKCECCDRLARCHDRPSSTLPPVPRRPAAPVPASTGWEPMGTRNLDNETGRRVFDDPHGRVAARVAARELDAEAERSGEHPLWVEMQRLTRYRHSTSGMLAAPSGGFYSATDVQAMIAEFVAARSAAQSTAPVSTEQAGGPP